MLEILILVGLARSLSRMAEGKGRSKGWAALGVLGWIGGEVMGAIVGALTADGTGAIYGLALVGAVIGGTTAYFIVRSLPAAGMFAPRPETQVAVNPHYDPSNPYSPPRIDEK